LDGLHVIAALVAVAVVCLALIVLLYLQQQRHQEALDQRETAWFTERQELLDRIQRPEILPYRPREERPGPDEDAREEAAKLAQVGRVIPMRPDAD
jgi:hypothetical protein